MCRAFGRPEEILDAVVIVDDKCVADASHGGVAIDGPVGDDVPCPGRLASGIGIFLAYPIELLRGDAVAFGREHDDVMGVACHLVHPQYALASVE